ncbi:MAG: hypothetical protein HQL27_06415 [Candidatus Omnitrophica bacterium]|nr:hypothetical protein [Candidatus Omnitrophota bacterium]
MTCPLMSSGMDMVVCFGVKIFLLSWIIFVPIAITARLDKIVKLLDDKNKK